MIHMKIDRDLANSVEFHNGIRAERSRIIARAVAWLVRRAVAAVRTYRSKQTLLGMRDEELRDVGLSRDDVERAGWF